MANIVAEANLIAKLLLRLNKLSLQGVRINSCEPSGLLIVDKDVKLTISKQSSHPRVSAPNANLAFTPHFCNKTRCSRS